jgi:hypothetical protein
MGVQGRDGLERLVPETLDQVVRIAEIFFEHTSVILEASGVVAGVMPERFGKRDHELVLPIREPKTKKIDKQSKRHRSTSVFPTYCFHFDQF